MWSKINVSCHCDICGANIDSYDECTMFVFETRFNIRFGWSTNISSRFLID